MKVNIKQIVGNWELGLAMDKHSIRSIPIGYDEWGHMRFETERTEVGESLFQLKYRDDWSQVKPLAPMPSRACLSSFQQCRVYRSNGCI